MPRASTGSTVILLLFGASACASDGPFDIGGRNQLPIMNGADENGRPATVKLLGDAGGFGTILCSGSIIADNVVLTAKHCVYGTAPGDWTIQTGGVGAGGGFTVREFRMTDGPGIDNEDIAVMILNESTGEVPYTYMRALPFSFIGDDITLVGYGETETGSSGRKKTTTDAVSYIDAKWFLTDSVGNGACHGDSGGTALHDATGELAGVIVFVTDDACGNGETGSTRTDQFLALIDDAVADAAGVCVPVGAEICGNGLDEDCALGADDGCLAMGEPCPASTACLSGRCEVIAGGAVCTQLCDWLHPSSACPSNAHCEVGLPTCLPQPGIEGFGPTDWGYCILGGPGAGAIGDACAAATDCANASCLPDDTGATRCLNPCTAAGEGCGAGESCTNRPGYECGACVPSGRGGFGAPCASSDECESEICTTDGTGSFCSDNCDAGCPEGYECGDDGVCVNEARPGRDGDPCRTDDDCESGLCATAEDGNRYCTDTCSETEPCPESFACSDVGGEDLCVPDLLLLGQECESNADCMSELCGHFGPEDWGGDGFINICTQFCSELAPCPGEFRCADVEGYQLCVPPPLEATDPPREKKQYGCGCAEGGFAGAVPATGLALLLAATLGRRRRREQRPVARRR